MIPQSLIPKLAALTVREADLGTEWVAAFQPLFHIRRLDDDTVEIAFEYLGASFLYSEVPRDKAGLERVIAEAAASFGRTLVAERVKFGHLEMPRSDYVPCAPWDRETEQQQKQTRLVPGAMIVVAVGILLASVLGVFQYFLGDEQDSLKLLASVALGCAGFVLLRGGFRRNFRSLIKFP